MEPTQAISKNTLKMLIRCSSWLALNRAVGDYSGNNHSRCIKRSGQQRGTSHQACLPSSKWKKKKARLDSELHQVRSIQVLESVANP